MKQAALLSFSKQGGKTAARIAAALQGEYQTEQYAPKGELKARTAALFSRVDALIFVGACGIAVRAIAPLVAAKTSDPAVLVVDETGRYVISLLSGHIGGANALAEKIAAAIGGTSVITTATDVNRRFSVDAWAAAQGLWIDSMPLAKAFSAAVLEKDLPFFADYPVTGDYPAGIFPAERGELGAAVSLRKIQPFSQTLLLVPPVLHLGIGCRRNTPEEKITQAVEAVCRAQDLHPRAIASVSSIDVKADEAGLLAFCAARGIRPRFYPAAVLAAVQGNFSVSPFVKQTVGVDNVCERSAMCTAGADASLLVPKTSRDGVTVAVACEKRRICFE